MSKYDLLNEEQKKAVFCTEGPLLILAGAGSGKTRVLTHRIAYLIEEKRVNPWNIMAITFTNKAAKEMRERVDHLIGEGGQQVWVSTFHSSCVRILRQHGEKLGFDRYFTIYDTDDSKKIIRECMKHFNIDSKQYKESTFLGVINHAKNQGISPKTFEKQGMGDYRQEMYAKVYTLYQDKLLKSNALDFGDLLMKVVELFANYPEVLKEYQNKFKYIMVDEYQDTNGIQFQLIYQLAGGHKNLCVVGDDDQSIYKFRGADIGNILNFEKNYPNAKVIKLEQNYRSTGNILEAANQVISNNVGRKAKKLWTNQEAGSLITLEKLSSEKEEGQFVTKEIIKGKEQEGNDYKDFAILYRTNAQSRVLEESLVRENIPYRILGGVSFYQRKEIKDVIAYLKVISNGQDDLAVKRIINVPRRGIGDTTVERIEKHASENDMSFFDTLANAKEVPELNRSEKKLMDFHRMIMDFRELPQGKNLVELFNVVLEKTEYKRSLELEGTDEAKDRLSNIDELLSKLTDYVQNHEEPSLNEFLEEVSLVADIDQYDENNDVVVLMTLHSAKGLEFPIVFLTGLEDGLFPSYMSISSGNEEDIEEERRLCYVGITRAKKKLYLTYAASRLINGQTQYNNLSRYVGEISKELFEKEESFHLKPEQHQPLSYARKNNPFFKSQPYQIHPAKHKIPVKEDVCIDYEAGDTVLHKTFGLGKVIKIEAGGKDYQVTVDFPSVGIKKLFAGLAGLKKS